MTINPIIVQAASSGGGPDLTGLVDRSATNLDLSGLGDTGSIGDYAFRDFYSLTSLTLPAGMTGSIGTSAFQSCNSLTSLTLPAGMTGGISQYAFQSCSSLASLTLPAGMTGSIGNNAFNGCFSLTTLDVPAGITSIGTTSSSARVFYNCTALEYIILRRTSVVTLGHVSSFQGGFEDPTCLFSVPADLVDAYKAANNWSTLADRIFAIPEELL